MAKVFVAVGREPTPEEVDDREPSAQVYYGGAYFFLYPAIKQLRDATDELIDPQENAFFAGEALDSLEAFLLKAQESARSQTSEWEQRVGVREGGEIEYQRTSRAKVLKILQGIASAAQKAREENKGVLFLGLKVNRHEPSGMIGLLFIVTAYPGLGQGHGVQQPS